jgi:hypothetical protein
VYGPVKGAFGPVEGVRGRFHGAADAGAAAAAAGGGPDGRPVSRDGARASAFAGDGKADLVTSATGANNSNGVVWLVPDLLAATAEDIQAVNLDSPGLPGSDTPAAGRGPTRNRITVVGPLLDTDGDKHLDVVVGAPASWTPGRATWTRSGCCAAPRRG